MSTENAHLLKGRYRLSIQLGSGGFGVVKKAYDLQLKKDVAIKIEEKFSAEALEHEREVYRSFETKHGFPTIHDYFETESSRYMAMTLLGESLEKKLKKCNYRMNLKTTLMIAQQLLDRIKDLHGNHYVHRDIKPENLMMGVGLYRNTLFMMDLGIAKIFKVNNYHVDWSEHSNVIGTSRYASINNHEGDALSRRDDLESMAYMLIYLQKGSLPWQGLKFSDTSKKNQKIYRIKRKTTPEKLCEGLEPEFEEFLKYARNLDYKEKPDYKYLKDLFRRLFVRKKFILDYDYQWNKAEPQPVKTNPHEMKGKTKKEKKKELLASRQKEAGKKNIKSMAEKEPSLSPQKKKQKVEDKPKTRKQKQEELLALAKSQAAEELKMKKKAQEELTALAVQQANYEKFMRMAISSHRNFKPLLI